MPVRLMLRLALPVLVILAVSGSRNLGADNAVTPDDLGFSPVIFQVPSRWSREMAASLISKRKD